MAKTGDYVSSFSVEGNTLIYRKPLQVKPKEATRRALGVAAVAAVHLPVKGLGEGAATGKHALQLLTAYQSLKALERTTLTTQLLADVLMDQLKALLILAEYALPISKSFRSIKWVQSGVDFVTLLRTVQDLFESTVSVFKEPTIELLLKELYVITKLVSSLVKVSGLGRNYSFPVSLALEFLALTLFLEDIRGQLALRVVVLTDVSVDAN